MLPDLQSRFARYEEQRAVIEGRVCVCSDVQLRAAPGAAAWSALQIVEHLVLSDETIGRTQAATPPEAYRFLPRSLKRALILAALNRNIRLPLPSPDLEPRGEASLSELLQRWDTARRGLCASLEDVKSAQETPFAHPVSGLLTAMQLLDLGLAHAAYHGRQMEQLLWRSNE